MPAKKSAVRVNLEQVWRPRPQEVVGVPLYVVDFRVALHGILSASNEFASLMQLQPEGDDYSCVTSHEYWPGWVRASWAIKLNRGPDMLPRAPYRVVVVDDNKLGNSYWRTVVVDALRGTKAGAKHLNANGVFVTYKGSRSSEAGRDDRYQTIKAIGWAVIAELGFPLYSQPLYEADDWAGHIHRLKRQAYAADSSSLLAARELYYGTVDSDWCQLVDDETRQYWANTGPWPSRLKNEAEVRAYVLKRMGVRIAKPSEIANVKQLQGDTADDLPAGSDLSLFDLCEANPEYDLALECLLETRQLLEDLCSPEANTKHTNLVKAVQWCSANGLPIVARP